MLMKMVSLRQMMPYSACMLMCWKYLPSCVLQLVQHIHQRAMWEASSSVVQ